VTWEAIGAIGEVVGALVVAATLAFLAVQVRQNSKAINATITHGNIPTRNGASVVCEVSCFSKAIHTMTSSSSTSTPWRLCQIIASNSIRTLENDNKTTPQLNCQVALMASST
jgi:hypothetical protein